MIVTTKKLFEPAYGKYAIGAYNINNAEQTMGLFRGCVDSQAPFIIQISKGARSYTNKRMLEAIIRAADEIFPEAIFAVHLDHGDEKTCMDCIESGFYSSVMIDASHEPFEKNIEITRRVVDAAHATRHGGRGRVGPVGRRRGACRRGRGQRQADRPEPGQGVREALPAAIRWRVRSAPATAPSSSPARKGLRFDVLAEIQKRLPGFPLVMHGSSSVPQEEVERINAAGGELKGAKGVDDNQFRRGGGAGRDQDQHRHRRPPGVDARASRVLPRPSRRSSTCARSGKVFMAEYAKFIADKNEKLGSAGQIPAIRAALA